MMKERPDFQVFRSSAGSGKTYNLAREYIRLALKNPGYFRHILAVTFTNKATHEMKSRIIRDLSEISLGESPLAEELMIGMGINASLLGEKAGYVLRSILHDYSHFSVSTIDSFFQKVINSFSREMGLQGGYEVELDLDRVLSEITDLMFLDLDRDPGLLDWLLQFSQAKMEEERGWDVRNEIMGLGREIFNESFQGIADQLAGAREKEGSIAGLKNELARIKYAMEEKMKDFARQGIQAINDSGFDIGDFFQGKAGPAGYFSKVLLNLNFSPNKYVSNARNNPEGWVTKKSSNREELMRIVRGNLAPILDECLDYFEKNSRRYYSANELYRYLYTFGLLATLVDMLQKYRDEHGKILISDLSGFLRSIIRDCDAPFIYEKTGSFFEHFLIDEFQDTSAIQWNNFIPLVKNSLSQGKFNMVVGDVKQSIYRWRGGDWRILDHIVEKSIGKDYIGYKNLNANWRSRKNIVSFNNYFFTASVSILDEFMAGQTEQGMANNSFFFRKVWEDVRQQVPDAKKSTEGGYVRIKFIPESNDDPEAGQGKFKEKALRELPRLFEHVRDNGMQLKDMAIIVRSNNEGREIANFMLEFTASPQAKKGYKYDVISSESLALEASSSVNILVNVLRLFPDPDNDLARINLVYHYRKLFPPEGDLSWHLAYRTAMEGKKDFGILKNILPGSFIDRFREYPGMPVNELISALISDLGLTGLEGEYPYLLGFQDAVLEFIKKERSDIKAFLDWWDDKGKERSISLPQNQDAASIMTIHKSKGLEFKVVIIPFCNWNFDHNARFDNILWVDAAKTVPGILSAAPVKYSAHLAETNYAGEYFEERLMSYIDNLNLLYVAFTRASEALFVIVPHSGPDTKDFKPDHTGKLVLNVIGPGSGRIASQNDFSGRWDESSLCYTIGEFSEVKKSFQEENEIRLDKIISSPWRTRISFRRVAESAFVPDGSARVIQLNIGLAVHDILSRVIKITDMDHEIERAVISGEIPADRLDEIKSSLARLMEEPRISEWFSGRWEVRTEVPVIPAPGELNRMDRVMIRDGKAIVLDYKTGKKRREDIAQVRDYIRILAEMEYRDVEGYLLYLDNGELVKV